MKFCCSLLTIEKSLTCGLVVIVSLSLQTMNTHRLLSATIKKRKKNVFLPASLVYNDSNITINSCDQFTMHQRMECKNTITQHSTRKWFQIWLLMSFGIVSPQNADKEMFQLFLKHSSLWADTSSMWQSWRQSTDKKTNFSFWLSLKLRKTSLKFSYLSTLDNSTRRSVLFIGLLIWSVWRPELWLYTVRYSLTWGKHEKPGVSRLTFELHLNQTTIGKLGNNNQIITKSAVATTKSSKNNKIHW